MIYVIAAVILVFAVGMLITFKVERIIFGKRCEKNPDVKYFEVSDFPGLEKSPVSFTSGKNTLRGGIYSYPLQRYRGLVIFSHGMWGGHINYMTEIEHFAKNGFRVLGYDSTGTMESDGKNTVGMHRGGLDLISCIKYVESDCELAGMKRILVGHSWGAFSIGLATGAGMRANGAVMISGPDCVSRSIIDAARQQGVNLGFLKMFIYMYEVARFGAFGMRRATWGMENRKYPILAIHGDMDVMVTLKNSIAWRIKSRGESGYRIIPGKHHNPYLTDRAEVAMAKFGSGVDVDKTDFSLLVEEDVQVMGIIDGFIDSCLDNKEEEDESR